jgi:outer membrane lipoprotein carrier protein
MKKLFFLIIAVTFFGWRPVLAQDDTKAKTILNELSADIKSYGLIKIDFTSKIENKSNNTNESKDGTIWLKGEKYRLEITGQTVICDGKTVWTYIKDANEVQINTIQADEDAITNPLKLLNSWEKNFKPKLIKEATEGGKTIQTIDLTPLKSKSYHKVRLKIDKTKKQIVSSTVYDKNGSTFSYILKTFITNQTVNDSYFTFKASDFPGVEINDMR